MSVGEAVQLSFVILGLVGLFFVWLSALEYSGRDHFNESLVTLAANYANKLRAPVSRREVLTEKGVIALRNSLSLNPFSGYLAESDISWIYEVQGRVKRVRTEENWIETYAVTAELARPDVPTGDPAEAVKLSLVKVSNRIQVGYMELQNGRMDEKEFLRLLRSATKERGHYGWWKDVQLLPESIRPKIRAIGWPETVVFLDHVGRGTAFGLFVGIILGGGQLIAESSAWATLAPVVAGIAGGVVHGASVHRRVRVYGAERDSRYSRWAKRNPLAEYIVALIIIGAMPVTFVSVVNLLGPF